MTTTGWTKAQRDRVKAARTTQAEPKWFADAELLGAFHARHGRWPSKHTATAAEKRLAYFAADARSIASGSRGTTRHLSPVRRAHLDAVAPGWLPDRELDWQRKADAVAAFRDANGRLPSLRPQAPEESSLAAWLANARGSNMALSPARRTYLDRVVPGWHRTGADDWADSAEQVAVFVRSHGRVPRHGGKNLIAGEVPLGSWLGRQRKLFRQGTLETDRLEHLNEHMPTWFDARKRDRASAWAVKSNAFVAFFAEHGRLPHAMGPGVPDDEKVLGVWRGATAKAARNGELSAHRAAHLDARVPGWRRDRDVEFRAVVDKAAAFALERGQRPRAHVDVAARTQAGAQTQWLTSMRKRAKAGKLAPARVAYLDEVLAGWSKPRRRPAGSRQADALARRAASEVRREAAFVASTDVLAQFYGTNGCLPSQYAARATPEKISSTFLDRQRALARRGTLVASRRAHLDACVPGWRGSARAAAAAPHI